MIAPQPARDSSAQQSGEAGGPTVLRILLGGQLRRLRESRDISRESAGWEIRASYAKIGRLESGRVGFKERDVADLLTMYGVTDARERETFLALVRRANEPGWWYRYGDVLPSWFEMYVGLEQAAFLVRTYEVQFVPGLLQTEDYARAVILLGHPGASKAEVERRVELRTTRQELLRSPQAPDLWAVVDEAALRRPHGGLQTLRAQIRRLIALTELPNVTLQVVPFGLGGHAAAGGPFTILRFADPDLPDIVYLEQLTSALYLDKRPDIDNYMAVMDRLCVEAESPAQTIQFLNQLAKEI